MTENVDTRIFWTADEYKSIARQLVKFYPKAMEGYLPGLLLVDLNTAIRAAIPPGRQRRMSCQAHLVSFERRLRDAVQGKSLWSKEQFDKLEQKKPAPPKPAAPPPPPPPPKAEADDWRHSPRTLWTPQEWDQLLKIIYEIDPALEGRKDWLTLNILNEAAARMARPRKFYQASAARRHLDEARARHAGKRAMRRAPPPTPEPPAVIDKPIPVTKPAPAQAQAAAPTPDPFKPVVWTREEWLAIAEELHKLHALQNYPYRTNLTGLDSEDVAFAQERVLPFERQRRHLKIASFATMRASLLRAFADLREKLDEANKPKPEPKAEPKSSVVVAMPTVAAQPAPEPTPEPIPEPVAAAPEPAPADGVDPYRAAFAPLMALLAGEVAKHLQPMVAATVNEAMAKMMGALFTPPPAETPEAPRLAPVVAHLLPALVAAAQAQAQAPAFVAKVEAPKPPEKPRRLSIGILTNRDKQYTTELEKAFPMVDIRIGDVSVTHAAERVANCDRVICMVKWVDHVSQRTLKKLAKDRYIDCNGGMSDLKRLIGIWLRAQGIKVEVAA